ncbi:MAG: beta-phosphoglucomutase family hydrolase [Candidatus Omnitrophota bacterium]|nr:beta-phosphoglucomutase family hydrolase [Candidatus Omnitrophota bacterium]
MKLKGAIFDLDGVIVDTVPLHFKAWKRMFSGYGREFTFEDYKNKIDGIPRISGAKAILTGLSEEELRKAGGKKQDYFLELLTQEGIKVYSGTLDLIKQLKQNNIRVGVISSSKNCLPILKKQGIDNLFEVIITGFDIKKGKPDPEVFFSASQKLKLSPEECIVFEDAVLGVEAAKRGNFRCVGIDRYREPARLAKADLVVNDLSEVNLERLKELYNG